MTTVRPPNLVDSVELTNPEAIVRLNKQETQGGERGGRRSNCQARREKKSIPECDCVLNKYHHHDWFLKTRNLKTKTSKKEAFHSFFDFQEKQTELVYWKRNLRKGAFCFVGDN